MGAACSSDPAKTVKDGAGASTGNPSMPQAGQHRITIRDRFETIEEVQKALRSAGLESSDLVVAIDLTKSNEWSGNESFGGAPLQDLSSHGCAACQYAPRACSAVLVRSACAAQLQSDRTHYGFLPCNLHNMLLPRPCLPVHKAQRCAGGMCGAGHVSA